MRIRDWPEEDRPGEKLLSKGEHALTDAELVAIFIKTGTKGRTALDVAKELLINHGGLKKLMSVPQQVVLETHGLGIAKYTSLKAAIELGRRYLSEELPLGTALNSTRATQRFLSDRLREYTSEVFACLFLDNHFRLICFEELFQGTINEANIYPREIVRRGIAHNAAKIILAHNHPSGRAAPSAADKEVTQLIKQSLGLIDIDVVDHVIIGRSEVFSFAENGLL